MIRPSGTLISVMTTLLKIVELKCPRAHAPVKLPHSRLVGGAKALEPITAELALSAVKMIKTKGAIQTTAIAMSATHRITSTTSIRSTPTGRKGQDHDVHHGIDGEETIDGQGWREEHEALT